MQQHTILYTKNIYKNKPFYIQKMCYMQNKSVIYNKQPKHVMYNNKNNIFTQPKICYIQINNTLNMLYIYTKRKIRTVSYIPMHYPSFT